MSTYETLMPVKARRADCARVCREHPGQLPVVVQSTATGRVHFLAVPRDATVSELEAAVRVELGVVGTKAALAIDGCSPAATTMVRDIFDACQQADGFLHVACARESAMGAKDICCVGNTGKYFADIENNPNLMGSM